METEPAGKLTEGQKEAIKLRATFKNGLAIGIAVTGGYVPLTVIFFSTKGFFGHDWFGVALLCLIAVTSYAVATDTHWDARKTIAKLDGPDAKPPAEDLAAYKKILRWGVGIGVIFSTVIVGYTYSAGIAAARL